MNFKWNKSCRTTYIIRVSAVPRNTAAITAQSTLEYTSYGRDMKSIIKYCASDNLWYSIDLI